ncbi:MAG: hypothetical protein JRH10_21160 [Deltaproteobacteria bacterium]|nr:hypothetical protein [Deltaproteobacteria bacterium]
MAFAIDLVLGAVLAVGFVVLARRAGRAELAWIASGLFAAGVLYPLMGWSTHGVGGMPVEWGGVALFGILAGLGVAVSAWFLMLGWGLHAFWDLLLPWVADTAYVPPWYAAACLGFDLVVAAAMAVRAWRGAPDLAGPAGAH